MLLDRRTAVLVDQHPLWLDTVTQMMGRGGVDVIGKATSSATALELVCERRPDLLVTEIRINGSTEDGLTLIRHVRERHRRGRVVVLSMYEDVLHIEAAFAAGANAYVFKGAHSDDLKAAIRQVFNRTFYLPDVRPSPASVTELVDYDAPALTRREHEILLLVAEGHSNAELARMLHVTGQTVKFHLSNIYRKLNVANRTEASRWAQLRGLLAMPAPNGAA
jgi:DNA-binding NarL/FixJ family response regulator